MSLWGVILWWRYRRVTLRWTAPTAYTTGAPIGSPVTYQVCEDASYAFAPIASGLTATSYAVRVARGHLYCFYVRAEVGGHVSAGSNVVCVNV